MLLVLLRCYGSGCGGRGAGPWPPVPAAARMSAGPALLAPSAAIAIAISAAAVVACGGTTSRTMRFWAALVTPIVWASIWRNQPPSTAPVPAIVGSSRNRSPGGADGRVGAGAVVRVLVAEVMSSAPFSVPPARRWLRSGGSCWCRLPAGAGQRDRGWCAGPAGLRVGVVAGLVAGTAAPVADRGGRPGPCPSRGPRGAVSGGGVGQELPDRPDSATIQLIGAVTAEPVQLTGNLDRWSGQGTTGPDDHDLLAVEVQRPAAVACAGRAGRGAQRDLTGGERP